MYSYILLDELAFLPTVKKKKNSYIVQLDKYESTSYRYNPLIPPRGNEPPTHCYLFGIFTLPSFIEIGSVVCAALYADRRGMHKHIKTTYF
jgi:hypothetical protein